MAKRRSNGTGSIKKRANGTYQISLMVGRTPEGKRNMKYFSGKTVTEARKKMKAYTDALEAGMNMDANYTLQEWADVVLSVHAANIKPVTLENYKYTLKLITKELGARKIIDLKPIDVERLLAKLKEEGRSDSAISQVRGLLYMIFDKAVGNDLVRKNIVQYVSKQRKTVPEEKERFSDEEVTILLQSLPATRIGYSIAILIGCGLRSQELLALTRSNIETDGSKIYVRNAISMVRGTAIVSTPKSFASYRTVPVPSNIRHCALALRDTDNMYIWQSPVDTKPINPKTFRKYYRETIETIPGVRYLSPHACRHTCASILHAQGVDPYTLQSILGHTTLDMTHHYTHVHPDTQKDAAERFAKAFPVTNNVPPQETLDNLIADAEKVQQKRCHSGEHSVELEPR